MATKDLTGQVFERLTVRCLDEERSTKKKKYWICDCECGGEISTRTDTLNCGRSKSCGCYRGEVLKENAFKEKHGMWGTRFYKIWDGIKNRCTRPTHRSYPRYGGRGIKVCKEWKDDFTNFYNDMYESYIEHSKTYGEEETTIERLDSNGNYCKDNCCWKTNKEQNYNKRNTTIVIGVNGEELTLLDISKKYDIDITLLENRRDYCKRKECEITLDSLVGGIF
jgi:hypothetical protein